MVKVFELDGDYRCERDLHHHLTALFENVSPLRIGRKDTLVRYEKPTTGTYQWSGEYPSAGNIDIFFVPNNADPNLASPLGGLAVEVNCNYTSVTKNMQDLIKLLDPLNQFAESVYVVVGTDRAMRRSVELGLEDAITYLATERTGGAFSPVRVLLIEELAGWRFLYEGNLAEDDGEVKIGWSELCKRTLLSGGAGGDPMRMLGKEEAKRLLEDRMRREGIPLTKTVARCMFNVTTTRDKREECHFGKTPLWDHVVERSGEQVTYAVFVDWLDKLVKYGKSRQR
jgi:hypothetical protein